MNHLLLVHPFEVKGPQVKPHKKISDFLFTSCLDIKDKVGVDVAWRQCEEGAAAAAEVTEVVEDIAFDEIAEPMVVDDVAVAGEEGGDTEIDEEPVTLRRSASKRRGRIQSSNSSLSS